MTDCGRTAAWFNCMYANASAPTAPTTPLHLRLMSALSVGSPPNKNGTNGTELTTSNGYTAGATGATPGALSASAAAAFGTFSSTTPVAVGNINVVSWSATGSWTTAVGVEIWDSAGTPVRLAQGALTANITGVANGDTIQFAASSVTLDPTQW
jgi:hypothetical protein